MAVYRRKGAETYSYDFEIKGRRFSGNTGARERRAAEQFEAAVARPKAAADVAVTSAREAQRAGKAPLNLREAVALYWQENGQHQAGANDAWRDFERMVEHFGPETTLDSITDAMCAAWVAKRRGEQRLMPLRKDGTRGAPRRVKNATVNRTTMGRLSALFGHAERKWKLKFPNKPAFREHWLPEAKPQPRFNPPDQRQRLQAELAEGYRELSAFAQASGKRKAECLLRWSQIDWEAGLVHIRQKGGGDHTFPLTAAGRAILARCRGHDPEWVFTYIARGRGGKAGHRVKGRRYPITMSGLNSIWRRAAKRAGHVGTFHSQRHTRAMTILRETGNLKMAQDALGHSRIETTARFYAHVLIEDLRAGIDRADAADPVLGPPKRRKAKEGGGK